MISPVVEHAAASDGLQLVRVTDERESPSLLFGEVDEPVEGAGADHPGFVDDDRRPRRQSVRVGWWSVAAFPL